jgi:asparagine synthase (glutamine-hydrolysing)
MSTEQSVRFSPRQPWSLSFDDHIQIYSAGIFESINALCRTLKLDATPDPLKIETILRSEKNPFAIIIQSQRFIVAAVDRIRSIPIFFYNSPTEFCVSNDAQAVREGASLDQVCWKSVRDFLLAGYVLGERTLYQNLHALQAGMFLIYSRESETLEKRTYFRYFPKPNHSINRADLLGRFGDVLNAAIIRTIQSANGRPIWVPLSGGLDSRLVLAKLKEHKYPNLNCFTYGLSGNHEVLLARRTAERLGVPWQFIRSRTNTLRKLYDSEERRRYADYADGLTSVPVYTEFETFYRIQKERLIPDESVIVNGQSGDFLFGGHVPNAFRSASTIDQIVEYIVKKHCSHWPKLLENDLNCEMFQSIKSELESICHSSATPTNDDLLGLYEFWEWIERQTKATVNNQRLYDFFGYKWSLPLWDPGLVNFWATVPYEYKINQSLHQEYLQKYNYRGIFDRGRARQTAFVGPYFWVVWAARALGIIGGNSWKQRFYEYMFYYTYFRPQLGLFGKDIYRLNFRKTRRPRVVALGARFRLNELGILGMTSDDLPFTLVENERTSPRN